MTNDDTHAATGRLARLATTGLLVLSATLAGCAQQQTRPHKIVPDHDRPFPLGAYTDPFWETQQTNAEAADFIFYDHEFEGDTAKLAPSARRHLESVAMRLEHVPFPVVIERSQYDRKPDLDKERRRTVLEQLARMGVTNLDDRVVIAPSYVQGYTAMEAERAYSRVIGGGGLFGFGGAGRGGGGGGGGGFR